MTPTTMPSRLADGPLDQAAVQRLEHGLVTLLRWLQDRATVDQLARQSGHALPPASWALLGHLDTHGAMRVSDVAACHGVHTSSIIPRLNALQATGLIQRATPPGDARVSLISITNAGRRALSSVRAARQAALSEALDGIDARSLATTGDVLAMLAASLTNEPQRDHHRTRRLR